MNLIEPLRDMREAAEAEFRRVYESDCDDIGEFEVMISDIRNGEIPESIVRYCKAELAGFVNASMALHRAEREELRRRTMIQVLND